MTNLSIDRFQTTAKILKDGGVPCYSFPTTAAKALGALYKFQKVQTRNIGEPKKFTDIDSSLSLPKGNGTFLPSSDVFKILSAYGILVADWRIAKNTDEAILYANEIGFPVVIKAEASSLVHKSDLGGVAINIKNAGEVKLAVDRMKLKFKNEELKFLVQKFLPGGKELIVGVTAQKELEPLIMFGLGGIYVEVLKDVIFKLSPVTELEAEEMLSSIKASKLLDGVRGQSGVNKKSIIEIIQRISQLVNDFPQIKEMDLNPIMAFEDKTIVVDARIKI